MTATLLCFTLAQMRRVRSPAFASAHRPPHRCLPACSFTASSSADQLIHGEGSAALRREGEWSLPPLVYHEVRRSMSFDTFAPHIDHPICLPPPRLPATPSLLRRATAVPGQRNIASRWASRAGAASPRVCSVLFGPSSSARASSEPPPAFCRRPSGPPSSSLAPSSFARRRARFRHTNSQVRGPRGGAPRGRRRARRPRVLPPDRLLAPRRVL